MQSALPAPDELTPTVTKSFLLWPIVPISSFQDFYLYPLIPPRAVHRPSRAPPLTFPPPRPSPPAAPRRGTPLPNCPGTVGPAFTTGGTAHLHPAYRLPARDGFAGHPRWPAPAAPAPVKLGHAAPTGASTVTVRALPPRRQCRAMSHWIQRSQPGGHYPASRTGHGSRDSPYRPGGGQPGPRAVVLPGQACQARGGRLLIVPGSRVPRRGLSDPAATLGSVLPPGGRGLDIPGV